MRKFIMILGLGFSIQASAAGTCNLPDGYDEDSYSQKESLHVTGSTDLDSVQAGQIIILARHVNKAVPEDQELHALSEAVRYLMEGSEGEDVYLNLEIAQTKPNPTEVDTAIFYPGGNPVGLIFEKNTTNIIGQIDDSTVRCR